MKKMIKIFKSIIVSALFLASSNAHSFGDNYSPKNILGFYDSKDEGVRTGIKAYLQGLGTGLLWANSELRINKRPEIFCGISDKVFNYEDFYRIYVDEYLRHKKIYDEESAAPGLILKRGIKHEYPC